MQTNSTQPKSVGRPPRSRADSGTVRESFLDQAVVLFSRQGAASTSVATIAKAVQVTPAMAHYYFSSREKLLDAVATERIFPFIDHVWHDFAIEPDPGAPILPLLEGLIDRAMQITRGSPWVPGLWVSEVLSHTGLFRERVMDYVNQRYMPVYEAAFARAQARGEINPRLEARLVVVSILGCTMLPHSLRAISQPEFSINTPAFAEELAAHAKLLLLPGLVANHDDSALKEPDYA